MHLKNNHFPCNMFFILFICTFACVKNVVGRSDDKSIIHCSSIDSLFKYNTFYSIKDTFVFCKKGLLCYKNDRTKTTFEKFFTAHELNYTNGIISDTGDYGVSTTISMQCMRGLSEVRYVYLFYIDRYLMRDLISSTNTVKLNYNLYTYLALENINTGEKLIMGDNINSQKGDKIFSKLLRIWKNNKLLNRIVHIKKMTPLQYLGYRWDIE